MGGGGVDFIIFIQVLVYLVIDLQISAKRKNYGDVAVEGIEKSLAS